MRQMAHSAANGSSFNIRASKSVKTENGSGASSSERSIVGARLPCGFLRAAKTVGRGATGTPPSQSLCWELIHPARLRIGLTKNSKPSSQRNRFVSRSSEQLAGSQVFCILPSVGPRNSPHRSPPASFQHLPAASALFDLSISAIKTHTSDTEQRFSPMHF